MKNFWHKLWYIFDPPCLLCEEASTGGENQICPDCRKKLRLLKVENRCHGCGGVLDTALDVCSACMNEEKRPWVDAVCAAEYSGEMKELIGRFKFKNRPEFARAIAYLLIEALRKVDFPVDCIVPIPLHPTKKFLRSFDQTELLARVISEQIDVPSLRALKRIHRGEKQAQLKRSGRIQNVKNLFAVTSPDIIKGKTPLLLDDVFTTGATLCSATKTLLKAGAKSVYVAACCRTPFHVFDLPQDSLYYENSDAVDSKI